MTRDPKDDELLRALRAASAPAELEPSELDALVAGALESADVTPEEAAAAETLRKEIEAGTNELVNALRAAASPRDLSELEHRALVRSQVAGPRHGPSRVRVVFGGLATTLALAAAVVLAIRASEPAPLGAALVPARSTQPLFDAPFTAEGTTARIDRIALARAGDFRSNRFATWGVR